MLDRIGPSTEIGVWVDSNGKGILKVFYWIEYKFHNDVAQWSNNFKLLPNLIFVNELFYIYNILTTLSLWEMAIVCLSGDQAWHWMGIAGPNLCAEAIFLWC